MIWDAVIRGAGPAGLAAALELSREGWTVLLVERSRFPREKVCGGFVGPENKSFLRRHGVLEELFERGAQEVREIYLTAANGAQLRMPVTLHGRSDTALGISRKEFDCALLEQAARQGVTVRTEASIQLLSGSPNRCRLEPLSGGVEEFETRYFIDAAGGGAHLENCEGEVYLGMAASFTRPEAAENRVMLHFIQGGHMGMNTFEDGKLNACYLVNQKLVEQVQGEKEALLELFVEQSPAVRSLLHGQKQLSAWKGIRFGLPQKPRFFSEGIFYAGDAVSPIHPVVGGGITMALTGGTLLAQTLYQSTQSGLDLGASAQAYERAWKKAFALRLWIARWLGRLGHQEATASAVIDFLSMNRRWAHGIYGTQHKYEERIPVYA